MITSLSDLVQKHCILGPQKRCPKCEEFWPADSEFYSLRKSRGTLSSWCRACTTEASKSAARKSA